MATTTTKFEPNPATGRTFANQSKLPKLPIPPLEDTCRRYLRALEGLQTPKEHEITKLAVGDFLRNEGPRIQEELKKWAENKDSYIEDFW
jgi:carnitine O-acetyltransferase